MFKTRLQGRKAADIASANNIKIGNGTSAVVTGTTDIHTIYTLNWFSGAIILLRFSGSIVLKNQGTAASGYARLRLAGGVDANLYDGCEIVLWYDGTDWREVCRYWDRPPVLYASASSVGNIGTGEDDLMSYSVPASTLAVNGHCLRVTASGTFAATANNKRLRAYFGSDLLYDSGAMAITAASDWRMEIEIIRTGAATQKACATFRCSDTTATGPAVDYTTPTRTLSGAITLKWTGEATADNDIVQETARINWEPV